MTTTFYIIWYLILRMIFMLLIPFGMASVSPKTKGKTAFLVKLKLYEKRLEVEVKLVEVE